MSFGCGTGTIWSATPTPFLDNGKLDIVGLEHVVTQHLSLGVTGLFLAGTCGEGPFMIDDQRVELIRTMRKLAGEKLTLAVQVSDTSAARVCHNISRASDAGADSVVIAPPWIERFANRDFLRRYFIESIESTKMPVGIYVLKTTPGSPLDLHLWTEIAEHPQTRLIKDSSASGEYCRVFGEIRKKRPDLMLLNGNEFDVISSRENNYDGALLGTGILIAGFTRRAFDALATGDRETALAWQARSNEFLYDLFGRDLKLWLGGLKYALTRLEIFSSSFMHLVYRLSDDDRKRIDTTIKREMAFLRPRQEKKQGL